MLRASLVLGETDLGWQPETWTDGRVPGSTSGAGQCAYSAPHRLPLPGCGLFRSSLIPISGENIATPRVPIAHRVLVKHADELTGCSKGSLEEAELAAVTMPGSLKPSAMARACSARLLNALDFSKLVVMEYRLSCITYAAASVALSLKD